MNSTAQGMTDSRPEPLDVPWVGFDAPRSPNYITGRQKCPSSILGAQIATLPAAPILAALFAAASHLLTQGAWANQLASLLDLWLHTDIAPSLVKLAAA